MVVERAATAAIASSGFGGLVAADIASDVASGIPVGSHMGK